jgi:hypothetical protein
MVLLSAGLLFTLYVFLSTFDFYLALEAALPIKFHILRRLEAWCYLLRGFQSLFLEGTKKLDSAASGDGI